MKQPGQSTERAWGSPKVAVPGNSGRYTVKWICRGKDGGWHDVRGSYTLPVKYFTHWMPLPAPPVITENPFGYQADFSKFYYMDADRENAIAINSLMPVEVPDFLANHYHDGYVEMIMAGKKKQTKIPIFRAYEKPIAKTPSGAGIYESDNLQ